MPAGEGAPIDLVRSRVGLVAGLGTLIVTMVAFVGTLALSSTHPGEEAVTEQVLSLALVGVSTLALASFSTWFAASGFRAEGEALGRGVRQMTVADVMQRAVGVRTPDELGLLAVRLETLREHIAVYLESERGVRLALESADRYKTEFLTAVSHELRNPLNAILGFTDVLLHEIDGPLTPAQREDLELSRSAGTHLKELFSDVLDLSAAVSDRLVLHRTATDVCSIVDEVAGELQGQRRSRPVEIRVEGTEVPILADADPRRLRQIVTNLASNALKFTDRGEVLLSVFQQGGYVWISVVDTGVGIAPADLDQIFVEFGQATTPKRKTGGAGLGLAITKRLTEMHGGDISVRSELGVGSTFTVSLPVWRAP